MHRRQLLVPSGKIDRSQLVAERSVVGASPAPNIGAACAEEARLIAEQTIDRDAIATMFKVAKQYEDLAQEA